MKNRFILPPLVLGMLLVVFSLKAQETEDLQKIKSKYNTDVPSAVLTPDVVETRIGTLNFFDGIPTEETAQKVYDNLDFSRGMETFLNGIPAASMEGLRRGLEEIGIKESYQVPIADRLMDSDPLFLTGNTSTVYAFPFLNLEKDGATVVEIPAGAGPGTVNDAFFRFVIDMGAPGPDRGKGGKYLILPPDYQGDLEGPIGGKEQTVGGESYFVVKSTSYINWIPLRGFLVDGKPATANNMWKTGLKVYPLAQADNPPTMEFISISEKEMNTIHANDFTFYKELDEVIQREPVGFLDPELRGLFASIGIQKGKEFAPDERMTKILTEAVAVGNATARSMLWYERNPEEFLYEGSYWKRGYPGNNYQFLKDDGVGGRNLDARTMFFYFATVNTPMMAIKLIGKGSQYAWGYRDSKGSYLDGAKTYKVNIPANPPAEKFWSICVYDPQTRSMLQTDYPYPSKQSQRDSKMKVNKDGSIDIYFGPKAPKGQKNNWIQTVPEKGFFMVLRLYSPKEEWYAKTWRPGEIELIE
ncbi:DUF1254 domain-containing protein [Flavobacteriaceae bacterium]|nr:DUF1254 domain-containing protein [Flavobacteriaceae bacterium]